MNFKQYPDSRNRTLNQEDTISLNDSTYGDITSLADWRQGQIGKWDQEL